MNFAQSGKGPSLPPEQSEKCGRSRKVVAIKKTRRIRNLEARRPFLGPVLFEVPVKPLSVNQAYWNRPSGQPGRGRIKTGDLKAYQTLILQYAILATRNRTIHGEVVVMLRFFFETLGADIDGPVKPTLDALQAARVFENDNRVRLLLVEKEKDPDHPRLEVEVMPWTRPSEAQ